MLADQSGGGTDRAILLSRPHLLSAQAAPVFKWLSGWAKIPRITAQQVPSTGLENRNAGRHGKAKSRPPAKQTAAVHHPNCGDEALAIGPCPIRRDLGRPLAISLS